MYNSYADVLESYLIEPAIESITPRKPGIPGITNDIADIHSAANSIADSRGKMTKDIIDNITLSLNSSKAHLENCLNIFSDSNEINKNRSKINSVLKNNINQKRMTDIKKFVEDKANHIRYRKSGINFSWFLNISNLLIKIFDDMSNQNQSNDIK